MPIGNSNTGFTVTYPGLSQLVYSFLKCKECANAYELRLSPQGVANLSRVCKIYVDLNFRVSSAEDIGGALAMKLIS